MRNLARRPFLERAALPRDWRWPLVGALFALAACLAAADVHRVLAGAPFWSALTLPASISAQDIGAVLVHDSLLPRIATTLLCGAALGLAGTLMQQVLRNPLAEPMTLGVFPGAYLALSIATIWMPGWLALGRDTLALAGGAIAMLAVFALAWAQGMSPLGVILGGMVVNLYCGAISLAISVVHFDRLAGLQIWGGGALDQSGWQAALHLTVRLALCLVGAVLLYRPLSLFDAGDATVRNLGVAVGWMRGAALFVAVALTAFVVAEVGVIGFIGLAAPLLARLAGARRLRDRLVWAPLTGAALLWLTDEIVRFAARADVFAAHLIATGSVTALVGVPLLIALLPRLRTRPDTHAPHAPHHNSLAPRALPLLWAMLLPLVCVLSLMVSRSADGWSIATRAHIDALLFWRVPHLVAALAAGSLLATAGTLLQRMTANPMASPDLLGVGSGGMFGMVVVLFLSQRIVPAALFAGCVAGAFATLLLLLWFGRRARFAPERLLLVGISISALFQAVVGALMSSGDPRAGVLVDLLIGSTYYVAPGIAWSMAALALLALAVAPLTARWLGTLALGADAAASLGVPVGRARFALLLLAALATAAATVVVGPLSFVGLIAPHIARFSGARRPMPQLYLAATLGALLMVSADWLGRQIAFPQEVAAGLVATLLGGPWLVALVVLRGRRSA
ncbi:Fe(3+)-hydroxamate ABC transporter permease FhuB [Paraburkholderia tropica]|uniref:Iron complex transport system permease protein n=1 Tax=Paraburkholderia tropica TaxID=92647 RepID=A0AAQ1GFR1_9BURK|nr:Fe(3+)-hydroxamate ABC transporter permease FhuB [Paraburkholderia tropica]SEJ69239.1 iron complex transport system permease protein [Paraburkholderia tropica]